MWKIRFLNIKKKKKYQELNNEIKKEKKLTIEKQFLENDMGYLWWIYQVRKKKYTYNYIIYL